MANEWVPKPYVCPVHGRFVADVEVGSDGVAPGEPPDEAKCTRLIQGPDYFGQMFCGEYSLRAPIVDDDPGDEDRR